jgi:Restriction Enzyme Adenine Methylase Associated
LYEGVTMPQIEIDFEVFKELTNRRPTEDVTYNEVIRELLKFPKPLKAATKAPAKADKPWVVSNTSFPVGSEFMADHKGKSYSGIVSDGKLEINDGSKFTTPSAAAVHVTGSSVNGWRFWKCKLPGVTQFVLLERLRGRVN